MKIFSEQQIGELTGAHLRKLESQVESEQNDYLLNANETQYIEHLLSQCEIEPLELYFDKMFVSDTEKQIPAEHFPSTFNVYRGKSYPRQVITYHVPFTGNSQLLKSQPNTHVLWTTEVTLNGNCVCFDVVNFQDDPEQIKRTADSTLNNIKRQYEYLSTEIRAFNERLESRAREVLQSRKKTLLQQSNVLGSLGVPISKSQNVPATFSIPTVQRKVIVKPTAPSSSFVPEPALDDATFQSILQVIDEFGKVMERQPSIYQGKGEEPLRDLFLMQLTPHFQSVTGETFNKRGKTDILIRHEKNNVFVAECKIWKGWAEFLKAIDQLLSYLTWRDSKAAIMLFVQNKDLTAVLEQIKTNTSSHPCFVKFYGSPSSGRFNFEFHLPGDTTRSVQLTVLCFHFP